MNINPNLIQTSSQELNSLLHILLSTGMFVAGFTAFVLDNTVSGIHSQIYTLTRRIKISQDSQRQLTILGTDEERGLSKRNAASKETKSERDKTYDLPIGMNMIEKLVWCFMQRPFMKMTSQKCCTFQNVIILLQFSLHLIGLPCWNGFQYHPPTRNIPWHYYVDPSPTITKWNLRILQKYRKLFCYVKYQNFALYRKSQQF